MQQREQDDFRLQAALHDKQVKEKHIESPVVADDSNDVPDDIRKAFRQIAQENILRKHDQAIRRQQRA